MALSARIMNLAKRQVEDEQRAEQAQRDRERNELRESIRAGLEERRREVVKMRHDLTALEHQVIPLQGEYEKRQADVERFRVEKLLPAQAAMYAMSSAILSVEIRLEDAERQADYDIAALERKLSAPTGS